VLKVGLAVAIEDVPKEVTADEYKRDKITSEAVRDMHHKKHVLGAESYEDLMSKMQKNKSARNQGTD